LLSFFAQTVAVIVVFAEASSLLFVAGQLRLMHWRGGWRKEYPVACESRISQNRNMDCVMV